MLISVIAIIGGFIVLVWGADRFVMGASATAYNLGVSPLIIGITVVGFGTSAPEMLISVFAALQGNPVLAVGNAIGSNIANIGLILGITALVIPLTVKSQVLHRELPLSLGIMLLAFLFLVDEKLARLDGLILLTTLILAMAWLVVDALRARNGDPITDELEQEVPTHMPMPSAVGWLLLGMILLLASSRVLVWGAVNIAQDLGVSDLVIGLTIVAVGTSLPELAASITSALKGEHDIAIGNIIGSNIFNILGVLSLPGLILPFSLPDEVLRRDYPIMLGLTIFLFALAYGWHGHSGNIGRVAGTLLLVSFIGYQVLIYFSV